jgi:FMN phosphatase YigB (HAD superfamily)
MAIEALLFDLGKVLVDFEWDPTMNQLTAACRDPVEFRRVFLDAKLAHRYETGAMTTREFHEHLCRVGGLQMDLKCFRSAWSSMFQPELLVSRNLLERLCSRYPLILVSNTNEAHAEFIAEHYPVFEYFAHKVFSFEVGAMKPEPEIFRRAIDVSGKPAGSLFFTDDREENVLGARVMGMQAHQFRSEPELIDALSAAGVLV